MARNKIRYSYLLLDIFIVFLAFISISVIKPYNLSNYFHNYFSDIVILVFLWIPVSYFFKKYFYVSPNKRLQKILLRIFQSNFVIFSLTAIVMLLIHKRDYSLAVLLGTMSLATIAEILLWNSLHFFHRLKPTYEPSEVREKGIKPKKVFMPFPAFKEKVSTEQISDDQYAFLRELILKETNVDILVQIEAWVNLRSIHTYVLSTTTHFNILRLTGAYDCLINLHRINDIRYLNKFFEALNSRVLYGGSIIGLAETKAIRKKRILAKYPPVLNYIIYSIDFVIKRILPKFKLTRRLYFFITRGQNRVLSKAEIYGRLYSCGFEISEEQFVQNHLIFLARKIAEPLYPSDATYGPIIKLKRIGKNGKVIHVYKLRTMHPYSEFLQEYIYKKYNLAEGGKFNNDFRITTLGRIFRKFWLDELPMLYNLITGDIKLVGVRPISKHYFSLYSTEFQQRRIHYKPGLIPPYYVDLPKTIEEIEASEKKYLDQFDNSPFKTDFKYFFAAVYNILFKKARSK